MKSLKHSWPTWTIGERAAHPKFGGGVILNGIEDVSWRLRLIKDNFPDDLTSGHMFHEFGSDLGAYIGWNSPHAVPWEVLVRNIENGTFPHIAALTVPAFGWKGVESGALLSEDSTILQMVITCHVDAIVRTKWLKKRGLGKGIYIWWPAFDAERLYHGKPRRNELTREQAWKLLVSRWVDICKRTLKELERQNITLNEGEPLVWLEYKPRVPGNDYISTCTLANHFVKGVNEQVGRRVMALNNEWAHFLLGGKTVLDGTKETNEAGNFTGFFHANSAELAIVEYDATGRIIKGTTGEDFDWHVGAGSEERWKDQEAAVKLIAATDLDVIAEHDIDPSGDSPLEYYTMSRDNLEKMFKAAGWPQN